MKKNIVIMAFGCLSGSFTVPAQAEDGGLRFLEKVQTQQVERQEKEALLAAEQKAQAEQDAEALQARDQQQVDREAKPQ